MAISVNDARKARQQQDTGSHEQQIDRLLQRSPNYSGEWWYDAGDISREMQDAIIRLYRSYGWDVRFVCDQRDGSALVFSENQ